MKIGSGVVLGCGDWIRVGGVEFIVRYCGGGACAPSLCIVFSGADLACLIIAVHSGSGRRSERQPTNNAHYLRLWFRGR